MKFYKLYQPADKQIVGVTDGSVQAEIVESKWKNKNELKRYTDEYILGIVETLEKYDNGEDVAPPVFEYIKLRNKALVTDFISFSEAYTGGRFLISPIVKNILTDYKGNFKIYQSVSLYHLDKPIPGYSNLHILPLKTERAVNFEKSIFFTGTTGSGDKKLYYPPTYRDYLGLEDYAEELVEIEQLCLERDQINDLDLFTLDTFPEIYVSERLKQAFEKEKVIGVVFLDPEEPRLVFS